MKIPFRKNRLTPAWTYRASGIIWRLLVDARDTLVGETRDQEQKTASFFAVDAATGRELWSGLLLEEPWWIGIEAVEEGILFLHAYEQPNLPAHQGVWAVDARTGTILWNTPEVAFLFSSGEYVYAQKSLFDRRVFVRINRATGEPSDIDHETIQNVRQEAIDRTVDQTSVFPVVTDLPHLSADIGEIVRQELAGREGSGMMEHIDLGKTLLFSYYLPGASSTPERPLFENTFCIYARSERTLFYREVLEHGATAMLPGTFFVNGGRVYFVKDRRHLVAVRLPEEEDS